MWSAVTEPRPYTNRDRITEHARLGAGFFYSRLVSSMTPPSGPGKALIRMPGRAHIVYTWRSAALYEEAHSAAVAALKTEPLGWKPQTEFKVKRVRQLVLRDYLESYGVQVIFQPPPGEPGRRYPLATRCIPIPTALLQLRRWLEAFPLPAVFDFEAVRDQMEILETEGGNFYWRFPFLDDICLAG